MTNPKQHTCDCKAKPKPKPKPKPKSKPRAQNGKGDSPRNLSTEFRNNYDSISWKTKKK